jgi:hypothetical protein
VSTKPLYVRTWAYGHGRKPDRGWTGTYSIQFHRATGATPDDAIAFTAAEPVKYQWIDSGTDQPTVWFDFTTNQTPSGAYANSSIAVEPRQAGMVPAKYHFKSELWVQIGQNPHSMSSYSSITALLTAANPGGMADYYNYKNPNVLSGFQATMPDLPGLPKQGGGTGPNPRRYFYVITQDGSFGHPPVGLSASLTFLTDLQYLVPMALRADELVFHSHEVAELGVNFDGMSPLRGKSSRSSAASSSSAAGNGQVSFATAIRPG